MANRNHLKRSFEPSTPIIPSYLSGFAFGFGCACETGISMVARTPKVSPTSPSAAPSTKRRSRSLSRTTKPPHPTRRSFSTSPSSSSFMSGLTSASFRDANRSDATLGIKDVLAAGGSTMTSNTKSTTTIRTSFTSVLPTIHSAQPHSPNHYPTLLEPPAVPLSLLPRESISTASESTDSSPTTTNSMFDSPIIADTSPTSSPDSPNSVTPISNGFSALKSPTYFTKSDAKMTAPQSDAFLKPMQPASAQNSQSDSPTRRARNLKNLSLRLPTNACSRSPPISTAPIVESGRNLSAPPSPMHPIPKSSRRRQPNLTIQTPGFDRSRSSSILQLVPPTPTVKKPSLRHAESSPSLSSILSPTSSSRPPSLFPLKRSLDGYSDESEVSERPRTSSQTLFAPSEPLQEEEEDGPISRESRKGSERGYPDGPILIYDSGLYLYLEPNQEEAAKFDVVFNVAKEVTNPFTTPVEKQDTVMSVWKANVGELNARHQSEPNTAASEATFVSAFEFVPQETPTSSKPQNSGPEYIHVPWDHNSEILEDLYPLCEMIDEKISKGKSVLIHCQLGVSRSASLVIAYGLYKNQHLDFNSVYGLVKERSCWVGPNMSLIYQLTDFRSKLQNGSAATKKTLPSEWFEGSSGTNKALPKSASSSSPATKRPTVDPSTLFTHNPFSRTGAKNSSKRNISVRPLPLREKYQTLPSLSRPPRNEGMPSITQQSFFQPPAQTDHVMQDVPETPNLFSPKAPGFNAAPFSPEPASGSEYRSSIDGRPPPVGARPKAVNDPRSPQQLRLEPLIMRNIDEFL